MYLEFASAAIPPAVTQAASKKLRLRATVCSRR